MNMRPQTMVLDENFERLYVGCKNGTLVIFDTSSSKLLIMIHSIRLIKPNSKNYIKMMGLDSMKSILVCQMSCSSIICIQLV
jgi:fructose-1-phosphate kinase PfkB-like protein